MKSKRTRALVTLFLLMIVAMIPVIASAASHFAVAGDDVERPQAHIADFCPLERLVCSIDGRDGVILRSQGSGVIGIDVVIGMPVEKTLACAQCRGQEKQYANLFHSRQNVKLMPKE